MTYQKPKLLITKSGSLDISSTLVGAIGTGKVFI